MPLSSLREKKFKQNIEKMMSLFEQGDISALLEWMESASERSKDGSIPKETLRQYCCILLFRLRRNEEAEQIFKETMIFGTRLQILLKTHQYDRARKLVDEENESCLEVKSDNYVSIYEATREQADYDKALQFINNNIPWRLWPLEEAKKEIEKAE